MCYHTIEVIMLPDCYSTKHSPDLGKAITGALIENKYAVIFAWSLTWFAAARAYR